MKGMRRPPVDEKPKNFKSSTLSLLRYLKPWHAAIIISLILSLGSTALTLIAPDKMADTMAWTRHMNQIKAQAEELVIQEFSYR